MSVYNRKMFKRNARERLNQTAGVKGFSVGGSVTTNYMQAIPQLGQQGQVKTLQNIFQDTRLPTNVRIAARNMLGQVTSRANTPPPVQGIASISSFDPTLTRRAYDMNLQSPSPRIKPSGIDELATEPFTNIASSGPLMSPDDMMLQGPTGVPESTNQKVGVDPILFTDAFADNRDRDETFLQSLNIFGLYGPEAAIEKERQMQSLDPDIPGFRTPNQEPPQVPYSPDRSLGLGQPMPDELTTEPFSNAERPDRAPAMPDELTTEPFTNVASDDATLSEQTNPGKVAAETAIETVEKMSSEDPGSTVNAVGDLVNQFLENDDQESAADTLLAAHGQLDPDEPLSTDARIEKMRETIRKFYGRDPGEERRIDGLNLAMMGFAIAGGESSQALQNIANGALTGVKAMKEEKQRRQAREDKITGLAVSTILGREEKEEDRAFRKDLLDVSNKHDLTKFSLQDASQMKRLGMDMNFRALLADQDRVLRLDLKNKDIDMLNSRMTHEMNQLIMRLDSAEGIATDDRSSREQIAQAGETSAMTRSIIANLPDGYGFAMIEGQNKGLTGNDLIDYASENGQKFASDSLLTGPDSLRRAATTIIPQIMKDQGITYQEASKQLYNDPSFQKMYGGQVAALDIPLVEIRDASGLTGDKLIVGTILNADGDPVSSLSDIGTNKNYFTVQQDGTLLLGKK
jgi:uncharacterized protein (UPF0147 family)